MPCSEPGLITRYAFADRLHGLRRYELVHGLRGGCLHRGVARVGRAATAGRGHHHGHHAAAVRGAQRATSRRWPRVLPLPTAVASELSQCDGTETTAAAAFRRRSSCAIFAPLTISAELLHAPRVGRASAHRGATSARSHGWCGQRTARGAGPCTPRDCICASKIIALQMLSPKRTRHDLRHPPRESTSPLETEKRKKRDRESDWDCRLEPQNRDF